MEIEYRFNYPEDREEMKLVHLFHLPDEIVKVNSAEYDISLVWETNGITVSGTSFHTLEDRKMVSLMALMETLIAEALEDLVELEAEDYVIKIKFDHVEAYTHLGDWVKPFKTDSEAVKEIAKRMNDEGYFPNVWLQSDHGNMSLIDLHKDYGIDIDSIIKDDQ